MKLEKGCIHIYCGDGKGKTTAAFGMAFRCAGRGLNVLILQLLKCGMTGEVLLAERIPEITVLRGNAAGKFTFQMTDGEKEAVRKSHDERLSEVRRLLHTGNYRMLVLDELMAAWNNGLIDKQAVLELIAARPEDTEIVMTGRNPPDELVQLADYVSEIKKRKHPFDQGIAAREGIEL